MSKHPKSQTAKPSERATDTHSASQSDKVRLGFYDVPLELITPSLNSPRKVFDPVPLLELATSIKAHGLLHPIIVRPRGETNDGHPLFELVTGERRWVAARKAGLDRITCSVRELSDIEVIEIQLVENSQRVDLTPTEYAGIFAKLRSIEGKQ